MSFKFYCGFDQESIPSVKNIILILLLPIVWLPSIQNYYKSFVAVIFTLNVEKCLIK